MSALTVTFTDDRIGRRRDVPPLTVNVGPAPLTDADADDVAEALHKYAGKYLMSRDYEVAVDLDEHGHGKAWIGGGRFGFATITPAPLPAAV